MKLDSLKPVKGSTKNRKRIGRGHGSGLGKSAGRGDKGAGQRSGFKRRSWFEGGQCLLLEGCLCVGLQISLKKSFKL